MPAPHLHTPRLLLRPLAPSDERFYRGLYADPVVMRHVAAPLAPAATLRAFRVVLEQLAADPPLARYWILCPRAGDDDLGLMAWVQDRDDAGSAEVGVLLVAAAECRGYATEALAALADAVFAGPAQRRLWTRHARDNGPAVGLMRKLGFAPMADADGGPAPLRWQLERQAWLARQGPVFASLPANC
ncbi:MAG TPA: GNAT family protein [Luteimonas sp.]|nr:GNAT family protein [Luteimonas sp.]